MAIKTIENYISEHISKESEHLYRLWRATNTKLLYGRMASGHQQGRLLKMLVMMHRPESVLEIGTFTGYSALCLAEGLLATGGGEKSLVTFEINDEIEDFTRGWIDSSAVANLIDFRIGDALEEVPKMGRMFDMAFIDGDKRRYLDYYLMVKKHMRQGGIILADNTLWDGHVLEEETKDRQTLGIMAFNDYVAKDEDVEKVILPMRDGMTIIRICKKTD